jgi:hypothetical protein
MACALKHPNSERVSLLMKLFGHAQGVHRIDTPIASVRQEKNRCVLCQLVWPVSCRAGSQGLNLVR